MLIDPICGGVFGVLDWLIVDKLIEAQIERLEQGRDWGRRDEAVERLRDGLALRAETLRRQLAN